MKVKNLIVLSTLMVSLLTFTSFKTPTISNAPISESLIQDGLIVYATYSGHSDSGYNFVVKDRKGNEQTLTFQKVDDGVLKTFDLNSEALVGTKFKVIFNRNASSTDDNLVDTITSLEKMETAY
ncbi:hypothetical protein GCM10023311_10340 [Flaviramulus aquimarinus]|uniref:Uncharacterized protein n=1 Tax=Flaviramulus aquimarinus TaxID=1170456 RepID=A0ABP9EVZ2_9FLAO